MQNGSLIEGLVASSYDHAKVAEEADTAMNEGDRQRCVELIGLVYKLLDERAGIVSAINP
jgi:hypothetical protein